MKYKIFGNSNRKINIISIECVRTKIEFQTVRIRISQNKSEFCKQVVIFITEDF